jgi:hypothetical protein
VRMRKYRKLAEECLAMALKAEDQRKRRALLELASECLDLAKNNVRTAMLRAEVEALQRPAN